MFESEIAFVITNKGVDIARDIAGITSIRGYKLKPNPRLRIADTYYDTRGRLLGKKKIGLRTRRTGGQLFISMKSNPQRMAGMGLRRKEFESLWSYKSLGRVAKALKTLELPENKTLGTLPPSKVLARMGLEVVQERHTTRDVRDILDRGWSKTRIAELDIDRVTFLGKPRVQIFEVEIEAKAAGSLKSVQDVAAELESSYSGFLRVWPHGKLATGLAIQRLWNAGRLTHYLENERLKPGAFDAIDRTIATGQSKDPTD